MKLRMRAAALLACLAASLTNTPVYASGVDDLRAFYKSTRSIQTEFRQLQLDEQGVVTRSQEGRFWLQRPHKLRWVYERPYRQVMVNDGGRFWLYDEDLAQVTVRPSEEALHNAPLLLLSGGPELDVQFEIRSLPSAEGMDWVEIKPRAKEGDFVSARMGLKKGLPATLELADSLGQQTRILFMNIRSNTSIDDKQFRFSVPDGVEVIGMESAETAE